MTDKPTQTTNIVGQKATYNPKTGRVDYRPIYFDQFYRMTFWGNIQAKLNRWINGQF